MINFLYGCSGSGKSTKIASHIAEDLKNKNKVFLIVPEQQTVLTERKMTEVLPPSAQLDFEVLNFSRLANRVFRVYGGLSYNYISAAGKSLLAWHCLREISPLLNEYNKRADNDASFISLIENTINEMKAFSITPTKLEYAASKLPDDSLLRKKLFDISLIYASLEGLIAEQFDDATDDLHKLVKTLDEHNFFAGANVYIDSFSSFTEVEISIIKRIFTGAQNTTVSLGCDGPTGDLLHFDSIYNTSKKLLQICESSSLKYTYTTLDENKRARNNTLRYIEKNIWRLNAADTLDKPTYEPGDELTIIKCKDAFDEAQAAAVFIAQKVMEGASYRDFVIVARDISKWRGIIDSVLDDFGIPFFMSRHTDITTLPLIKLIYSALAIVSYNWRLPDIISYIKTGLAGIEYSECDILEEYTSTWNISGNRFITDEKWCMNPDGYRETLSENGECILDIVNTTRDKLKGPLLRFSIAIKSAMHAHDFCSATYDLLKDLDIPAQLQTEKARLEEIGDEAGASEISQLWGVVMTALDTIVTHLPEDAVLTIDDYTEALSLIFASCNILTIPTAYDEVTVGSASLLRTDKPTYAILIGVNEGEFPKIIKSSGIFNDTERRTLIDLGLSISNEGRNASNEELLYCYRAITQPSDGLLLTYSMVGHDSKAIKPSLLINRLIKLFPMLKINDFDSFGATEKIYHISQSIEYLHRLGKTPEGNALYDILSADDKYSQLLFTLTIPSSQSECILESKTTDNIFRNDINMSYSRLENYVKCRFMYYGKYILKLRESRVAEFQASDIGNFVHHILEKFFSEIKLESGIKTDLTKAEIEKITDAIISKYISSICQGKDLFSNRIKHLIIRLRRNTLLFIQSMMDEFSECKFIPSYFELPLKKNFGGDPSVPPHNFELNDGTKISLYGTIDRVDTYKKDENVYIRVVDYKTGSKVFREEDISVGLNLQLLLYLTSIWKTDSKDFRASLGIGDMGESEGNILPGGMVYFSAHEPNIKLERPTDEEKVRVMALDKIKRSGIYLSDEDVLRAMDPNLTGKYSPAKINANNEINLRSPALYSLADFGRIYDEMTKTITRIGNELRNGFVHAKPYSDKRHDAHCEYCSLSPFCRSIERKKR